MHWGIYLGIIIGCVWSFLVGIATVIEHNSKLHEKQGYIDINLKWILINFLSLIWNTIFTIIKYSIAIGWTSILVCMTLFLIGLMVLSDSSSSSIYGDWEPYAFMADWFEGELYWFGFIGDIFIQFCDVFGTVFKYIKIALKTVFVDPFVFIKKNFGKLFEIKLFRIGKPKE